MKIEIIVCGLLVICVAVLLFIYMRKHFLKSKKLGSRWDQYGFIHNALLTEMPIPYAVMAEDGKILWANDLFVSVFEKGQRNERYLSSYIHELNRSVFPKEEGVKAGQKGSTELFYLRSLVFSFKFFFVG